MAGAVLAALPLGALAADADSRGCAAGHEGPYPTFCAIPATPTDVRPAQAFKSAVVDVRVAGRRVVRDTAPQTFGLPEGQADAFSQSGQDAVAPAGPAPASADTEAFAAKARREVVAPRQPPRRAAPQPR